MGRVQSLNNNLLAPRLSKRRAEIGSLRAAQKLMKGPMDTRKSWCVVVLK